MIVEVYDPRLDTVEVPERSNSVAIIGAVAHAPLRGAGIEWARGLGKPNAVVYDLKGMFGDSEADLAL